MRNSVVIYHKESKIKVLDIEDARPQHDGFISDGWKHTATLNVCAYLEYLFNDCDNITKEIKNLNKI